MDTFQDLLARLEKDVDLARLRLEVEKTASLDPAHDIGHALRVAFWTCRIGGERVPWRNAVAAALCHDSVNYPKDSPLRSNASTDSANLSRTLLPDFGFDDEAIDDIASAIRDHSFSKGSAPVSPLGDALQDADRLDALGAIGVMRNISTAVRLGAIFFDLEDPWAERRPLNDTAFAIDHYSTKLRTLPLTMRTELGRAEGLRRLEVLDEFLNALSLEIFQPRPHRPE